MDETKKSEQTPVGEVALTPAQARMLRKARRSEVERGDRGAYAPCGVRGFCRVARSLARLGLAFLWDARGDGPADYVRGFTLTAGGRTLANRLLVEIQIDITPEGKAKLTRNGVAITVGRSDIARVAAAFDAFDAAEASR